MADSLSGGFSPIWNGLMMLTSLTSLQGLYLSQILIYLHRGLMPSQIGLFHDTQSLVLQLLMFSVIYWPNLKCYAFPPFSLLTQVLAKIRSDKALVLLIAPMWTTQNGYWLLLQLLTNLSILLSRKDNPSVSRAFSL